MIFLNNPRRNFLRVVTFAPLYAVWIAVSVTGELNADVADDVEIITDSEASEFATGVKAAGGMLDIVVLSSADERFELVEVGRNGVIGVPLYMVGMLNLLR